MTKEKKIYYRLDAKTKFFDWTPMGTGGLISVKEACDKMKVMEGFDEDARVRIVKVTEEIVEGA